VRLRFLGVQVINQDGDRLRRVSRCLQRLQAYAAEFNQAAVAKPRKGITRLCSGSEINCRSYAVTQLKMPCDKIRVKMRQDYVFNLECMFGGKRNVLVCIALRVNDGSCSCGLVAN